MMTPGPSAIPLPMVHTFGPWGFVRDANLNNPSSATFESANRAVYVPISVPVVCTARRLWWVNGATVSATYNIDCGIYSDAGYKPGARLVSTGSTAQGTANELQLVDVTDTVLSPGLYWLALTVSNAASTIFRGLTSTMYDALLRFEEASALPLPASATPTESSNANYYIFGFATTASP